MSPMISGALIPGQVFHGRYQIVRCLKFGGMGAVYECIHLKTRKHRALKVMLPQIIADEGMRERFELEARITATIESEHIVETFDAGIDEETGALFLVMELLRGEELGGLLKRRGTLPADEVVVLLSQAALALDRTHAAGIIHRDLKPENLFVTSRDDGSPRLKILDFGIAKVVADGTHTVKQTAAIGTPLYMSPEQFQGDGAIGPRADIYALGHIAYALLSGQPYWHDEQCSNPAVFAFFVLVMAGPPERPTRRAARHGVALPAAFDAWFARATARVPSDRFDRASVLVTELAVALGVTAPRPSVASAPRFAPDVPMIPLTEPDNESSSSVPTKLVLKVGVGAGPIVDPEPVGDIERAVTNTLSQPGARPSAHSAPSRPSRLRLVFLFPVSVVVAGIGLMVLIRMLQGGVTNSAPTGSSAAVSLTDPGTAMTGAPTASAFAAPSGAAPLASGAAPLASGPAPSASGAAAPVATSASSSGPVRTPSVLVRSAPTVLPGPARPVARPPQAPVPAPTASAKTANVGCLPPFTIDGAGHKHAKPQCL